VGKSIITFSTDHTVVTPGNELRDAFALKIMHIQDNAEVVMQASILASLTSSAMMMKKLLQSNSTVPRHHRIVFFFLFNASVPCPSMWHGESGIISTADARSIQ